ncbi:MAG: hypothetical protein E6I17_06960 [Chloroflexi bacterium]|nr:MAG: hypothetical protein E6I17_06960 [Chloroflexota bacterium]
MPTPRDVIFFETPAELRAWFEANHDTATELWLGYHRKRTGRASVSWPEVVDQELCFGWIDSVRYSLTDDTSAQRLTLEAVFRRHASAWKFFEAQPPSYRVTAAFWVMSAKREDTKKRRLEKLIAHSKIRERVPPFSSSPRSSGRGPRPAS